MQSFEPDFMNQNYNCVPAFIESATNATTWQHGMADAALAADVAVQWCYAAPTDVNKQPINTFILPFNTYKQPINTIHGPPTRSSRRWK